MIPRNYILDMLKPQSKTQNHGEEDNKPLFKGVRMRKWGRWVAEIRRPNSREKIWLGSHQTAEEAARAYDAAALCVRGPNTYFNFPNDLPQLQPSGDMATAQIQMEAAKHAGKKITHKTYL